MPEKESESQRDRESKILTRRTSRRGLLKGAAALGFGTAGLLLVGCDKGEKEDRTERSSPTPKVEVKDSTIEEWLETFRDLGWDIRLWQNSRRGQEIEFSDFKGQKLVVLGFTLPNQTRNEINPNYNYLESVLEAKRVLEKKGETITLIIIYSPNEIPPEQEEFIRDRIGEDEPLYVLSKTATPQRYYSSGPPWTEHPGIILVDKAGVCHEFPTDRSSFSDVKPFSDQLVEAVNQLN